MHLIVLMSKMLNDTLNQRIIQKINGHCISRNVFHQKWQQVDFKSIDNVVSGNIIKT